MAGFIWTGTVGAKTWRRWGSQPPGERTFQAKGQDSARASVGVHMEISVSGTESTWRRGREEQVREGIKAQVALILLLLFDCLVPMKLFLFYDIS